MNKKAFSLIELAVVVAVIGFITAGLMSAQSLVDIAKNFDNWIDEKKGITITQSIESPDEINNLMLWLDADGSSNFSGCSGSSHQNWISKSGSVNLSGRSGYNVSCVGYTNNNSPSGRSVLTRQSPYASIGGITSGQFKNYTLTITMKGSLTGPIFGYGNDADHGSGHPYYNASAIKIFPTYFYHRGVTVNYNIDNTKWYIFTLRFYDGYFSLNANGKEIGRSAQSPFTNYRSFPSLFCVTGFNHGQEYCSGGGPIAEILAYDRVLEDTEIRGIESYLSDKWGIPVDHGNSSNFEEYL